MLLTDLLLIYNMLRIIGWLTLPFIHQIKSPRMTDCLSLIQCRDQFGCGSRNGLVEKSLVRTSCLTFPRVAFCLCKTKKKFFNCNWNTAPRGWRNALEITRDRQDKRTEEPKSGKLWSAEWWFMDMNWNWEQAWIPAPQVNYCLCLFSVLGIREYVVHKINRNVKERKGTCVQKFRKRHKKFV